MKTLISLIALGVSTATFAAANIQKSDPSAAIMIKPDQKTFSIVLSANATTGYRWFLKKFNQTDFQYLNDQYLAPQTPLVGASGFARYTFTVKPAFHKAPYISDIAFTYTQPWNLTHQRVVHYEVISIPGKPALQNTHPRVPPLKTIPSHIKPKTSAITQPNSTTHHTLKSMDTSWLSLPKK